MKPIRPDSIAQHHSHNYFMRRMYPPMPLRPFSLRPRQDVPDSPGWVRFLTGAVCGAILLALVVF